MPSGRPAARATRSAGLAGHDPARIAVGAGRAGLCRRPGIVLNRNPPLRGLAIAHGPSRDSMVPVAAHVPAGARDESKSSAYPYPLLGAYWVMHCCTASVVPASVLVSVFAGSDVPHPMTNRTPYSLPEDRITDTLSDRAELATRGALTQETRRPDRPAAPVLDRRSASRASRMPGARRNSRGTRREYAEPRWPRSRSYA